MELPTSRSPECHIHCYDLLSAEMYCCSVSNNRGKYNVQGNSTAGTNNFLSVSHVCPCRTMTDVRHVPHPKFDPEMQWTNQNWTPLGMNLLQNNLSKDVWWGRHVYPKTCMYSITLASATMYVAASCRNPGKRLTKSSCAAVKFLCVTRTGTRHSYNFWENL